MLKNLKSIYLEDKKIKNVEGLIITKRYPPIKNYKNVDTISIVEIDYL